MAFNYELTRAIARGRDRDFARFFAGRAAEIKRFDDALAGLNERSEHDKAAEFVIYQGAPGCGKTSLFNHLRGLPAYDDVLFATIGLRDLTDESALQDIVWNHIEKASPRPSGEVAGFAGSTSRPERKDRRIDAVVLHLDEAQVVDEAARPGLLMLHTAGVGFPCAIVMTGLSHTERRVSSIEGLSRLAGNSAMRMGELTAAECVESTGAMLRQLDPDGSEDERSSAADLVATLSQGWPHHLCGAQVALCRELLRTSGALREVDADEVQRESDGNRRDYYLGRLAKPPLSNNPSNTAAIVVEVDKRRPASVDKLKQVCRDEMAKLTWTDQPDPYEFADALVEKGVVTITLDGRCEIPIPSMGEWAASMADGNPPPECRRARIADADASQ